MIWLVAPVFQHEGALPISLANVGVPLASGAWVFLFAGQLGKRRSSRSTTRTSSTCSRNPHQGGH